MPFSREKARELIADTYGEPAWDDYVLDRLAECFTSDAEEKLAAIAALCDEWDEAGLAGFPDEVRAILADTSRT